MRKIGMWTAALAAVLAVPTVARAHAFTCEKTASVDGGPAESAVVVDAYPATVTYAYTITNTHPTEVSVIEGLIDPMFPEGLGIALPFPIPVGGSTSASKTLTIPSYPACVALAAATVEGPVTLTNTLTVVFDGQPAASCSAQVICEAPPPGCLTRTPGYWGTHPNVTEAFLPVDSCGLELGSVLAGQAGSIIEDLCSTGTDAAVYGSPQEAQLVRQCAAAALNMAASEALGGSCSAFSSRFAACCSACGAPAEGCIEDLDAFNSSADTLLDDGEEIDLCHALDLPCAALPEACQDARGNGFVNDREGTSGEAGAGEGAGARGSCDEGGSGGGSSEGSASGGGALDGSASGGGALELQTGGNVNRASGGCAGGPGGLLALALAGLLPLLRRR